MEWYGLSRSNIIVAESDVNNSRQCKSNIVERA